MGEDSKIAWTDHTFNPWHGCVERSPGCNNCYARTFSARLGHGKRLPTIWGVDAARKPMSESYWHDPVKWNRKAVEAGVRRRVFCASMADVFELLPERNIHARVVQDAARARLWNLIEDTEALDWLLLTKRPENVAALVPPSWGDSIPWPANVWLGVTAEDQRRADERIPILLSIPARVRFVSHEPALERVDFSPYLSRGIHWIITGGESGPGARRYDLSWARSVVGQCRAAGVAPFVKQLGANPDQSSVEAERFGSLAAVVDRKGGVVSEWPTDLRIQEFPAAPAAEAAA